MMVTSVMEMGVVVIVREKNHTKDEMIIVYDQHHVNQSWDQILSRLHLKILKRGYELR